MLHSLLLSAAERCYVHRTNVTVLPLNILLCRIPDLVSKFLTVPMFRIVTFQCLNVITNIDTPETKIKHIEMMQMAMTRLLEIIPPSVDIAEAYARGTPNDQNFVKSLAVFLSSFLRNHGEALETEATQSLLLQSLEYMVNVSRVDEIEVSSKWSYAVCADVSGPNKTCDCVCCRDGSILSNELSFGLFYFLIGVQGVLGILERTRRSLISHAANVWEWWSDAAAAATAAHLVCTRA